MDDAPEPGIPDNRDWTTVIAGGCDECGFEPQDPVTTGDRLAAAAERWRSVLSRTDASSRPAPRIWSPVEYAGHSRDLIEVLGDRLTAMLATDNPTYSDFDGELAVREYEYWKADPGQLAANLTTDTVRVREILAQIDGKDWMRTGRRGDGYQFTINSLCQYIVHDVEHHLHDVDG